MPVRTGAQYIEGLRENQPEVYMNGERVKDVTTHPALSNGIQTLARLYDMQHDPEIADQMTYTSPTTGDQVGLSFILPKTPEDLQRRHTMMSHWARVSCGMMGRSPDFMNVNVMAMAAAGDYFAQNRPEFKKNIQDYYELVREKDLVLTHTLLNLQRSRAPGATMLEDRTDIGLAVVKETDAGIIVNGARVLATLAPLSEEIALYPTTSHMLPGGAPDRYSFAFAIPNNTPGLKFQCRESFDQGRSHFDHPLGSRFEEMDAVAFFDNVLVPWERVFLLGDVELCNNLQSATNRHLHSGHQIVTKNVVKCEFILGLANLMIQTLGSGQLPHVQQMMAEIIENLEVTKACLRAAEADAKIDKWGVLCPAELPLQVARNSFIRMYPRMAEILHLLGSSSLMALPTEADMNGPLADEINKYLETDTASAQERVRIFRLAWDTCCSAFAGRQILYERFFQADSVRNAVILYNMFDREPMTNWVSDFLHQE
ncbi:MAG: 4-hydroxyphenylacetate 3-monooxygenase, oxygenase component [SAR202 cluster bacterium Io17-Chloro-G7]|nr:MAG: 4-hydroxyphenylacetate 3-monooxygenase, oxygenase component [SAR202 cluster bacterium Io17-Chloro-G7]